VTQYFRLATDHGRELDCDMSFESVAGRPAVVIESRSGALSSGSARNAEYNPALELLLDRLAAAGFHVLEITLESRPAQALQAHERRLPLEWPLRLRSGMDIRQLRLLIADGQRAVAASPAKRVGTGNANRRIRLVVGGVATIPALAAVLQISTTVNLSPASADVGATHGGEQPAVGVVPWVAPGSPVPPTLLNRVLGGRPLPSALVDLLPLDPESPWTSTFRDKCASIESQRISAAFSEVLAIGNPYEPVLSRTQIAALRTLSVEDMDGLYRRLPLRQRTHNILMKEYAKPEQVFPGLARATFGELMSLRNFGAVSFFDLATCLDQAFEAVNIAAARNRELDERRKRSQDDVPLGRQLGLRLDLSQPSIVPWQQAGSPVLPKVLQRCLSRSVLPAALLTALPLDATSPWESRFLEEREFVDSASLTLAFSELRSIVNLSKPFLDHEQAALVKGVWESQTRSLFEELPLRARTRNALLRRFGAAEAVLPGLASSTVGEIFDLRHFGVISFLDLGTCLDQVLDRSRLPGASVIPHSSPAVDEDGNDSSEFATPRAPAFAGVIRRDDGRFGDLFDDDSETLEIFVSRAEDQELRWSCVQQVVYEVEAGCQLRAHQFLEDEAEDILSSALGEDARRWLPVFARRFGLDGRAPGTLDEAAALVGVTRERVRQVQKRLEGRLPRGETWAPAMDQARDLLEVVTPTTTTEVATAFAAAGLTRRDSWSAPELVAVAKLSGRILHVEQNGEWIGTAAELETVKQVRAAVRAVSGFFGVATEAQVITRLRESGDDPVEVGLVQAVLERDPAVHKLRSGYFWTDHAEGRNRLVNVSLRILTVLEPQTLEDMHEGVERAFTWRASTGGDRFKALLAPELEILPDFYVSHPAFRITEDGHVRATVSLPMEALGPEKMTMVGVLRAQNPPAMDRNSLIAACVDMGMSVSTAGVLVTYGEFIKRFAMNVWGLRGIHLSDREVALLQAEAKNRSALVDGTRVSGRTPTGRPWFARRITPSFLFSGVMSHDWERGRLQESRFDVIDGLDGERVGQLRFSGGFNYGYTSWLRKNGAKVGDVIRVTVDEDEGQCIVELGDEELLTEPFDW